ncbi:MAG: HTH-type transcriptional regulator/antitoxin HipB [Gammaproteobacteria bacterium]|jgi:HTH-type transcriptional regulator/antitoxin HipB
MGIRSNKDFGAYIRQARQKQNLRQIDLAKAASVRQALISDLENGVNSARLDTVFKVLAALKLDLSITDRVKPNFDPTEY